MSRIIQEWDLRRQELESLPQVPVLHHVKQDLIALGLVMAALLVPVMYIAACWLIGCVAANLLFP